MRESHRTVAIREYVGRLRRSPDEWLPWPNHVNELTAHNYVTAINHRRPPAPSALRTGEFAARHRGGELYVRFVPDGAQRAEYERYSASPRTPVQIAAARLTREVADLLHTLQTNRTCNMATLAERLRVSEQRARDVLEGDGDIRVRTLAEFAQALGYSVTITMEKLDA